METTRTFSVKSSAALAALLCVGAFRLLLGHVCPSQRTEGFEKPSGTPLRTGAGPQPQPVLRYACSRDVTNDESRISDQVRFQVPVDSRRLASRRPRLAAAGVRYSI